MPARHARSRTALTIFGIVCLGLALRLGTAWQSNQTHADSPARLSADEPGYDDLARGLLNGEGLTWPGRVPLYPAWLALLHRATGFSYAQAIYIQSFVGAIAVWLTFGLGRETFGRSAGLIAALGAAVDVVLVRQSVRFLSEILFTPAVLLVAIALTRALAAPSTRRGAWAGFWIGVANMIRPTLVFFPLVAALLFVGRRWRREGRSVGTSASMRAALAIVVVSTLVVLPWVVRNYVKYGAIYPLATSNAILWQGSPEYFHLLRDRGYTYLDVWNKVIYGPEGEGHDPGTIEGERYWRARAIRSIVREPLVYLRFSLEQAVTYWIGDPAADWGDSFLFDYRALRRWGFSRSLTAQYMAWRVFPLMALAALFLVRPAWKRLAGILAVLGYCTLLHALTHAEARLSEPLHPLLLVIVAGALVEMANRRVHRGASATPLPAGAEGAR